MPLSSSIYFHKGNLSSPCSNWRAGLCGVAWVRAGAPACCTPETLSRAETSCSDTQGFLQSKPQHQVFSKIKRAESKLHLPIFFHIEHEKALPAECAAEQTQHCASVKEGQPVSNATLSQQLDENVLRAPPCFPALILSHSTCCCTSKGSGLFLSVSQEKAPKHGCLGARLGERQEPRFPFVFRTIAAVCPRPFLLNEPQDLPSPAPAIQTRCAAQCFCCSGSLERGCNVNTLSHVCKGDSRRKMIKALGRKWHILLTCNSSTVLVQSITQFLSIKHNCYRQGKGALRDSAAKKSSFIGATRGQVERTSAGRTQPLAQAAQKLKRESTYYRAGITPRIILSQAQAERQ